MRIGIVDDMPETFACHAFEYIQKPFEPDQIRKVMEDVLRAMPPKARYLTFTSSRQTVRLLYEQFVSAEIFRLCRSPCPRQMISADQQGRAGQQDEH